MEVRWEGKRKDLTADKRGWTQIGQKTDIYFKKKLIEKETNLAILNFWHKAEKKVLVTKQKQSVRYPFYICHGPGM